VAIWREGVNGWEQVAPGNFVDEPALHDLVRNAPQLLPLAGDPAIAIVGSEVGLGSGSADLVGVETTGRLVLLEIKLRKNAESRRAVVAQILSYAAYLYGMDTSGLEGEVLGRHLRQAGHETLLDAARSVDQHGEVDSTSFAQELEESLATGRFRLVIVLDDIREELVQLVGYLEHIGDNLLIDLITVATYEIDGSRVLVPQRVDPERVQPPPVSARIARVKEAGYLVSGADDFEASIEHAEEQHRRDLQRLLEWARGLERASLAELSTYHGKERWTLLPRLPGENAGLVTVWNDAGPSLSLWRSVFERRAPNSIGPVEGALGARIAQGNTTRLQSDELLDVLSAAYREAAGLEPA
jgi:hypothetical protein